MAWLIESATYIRHDSSASNISSVVMPKRSIDTNYKRYLPDKPELLEPAPPVPVPELSSPNMPTSKLSVETPSIDMTITTDLKFSTGDSEFIPLFAVAPVYPQRALQRKLSGYVLLEFTITRDGSVKNVIVVEEEPPGVFTRSAINAAKKMKFQPRIVDGQAIEVRGVRRPFQFEIKK